jgi:hypothetical protein
MSDHIPDTGKMVCAHCGAEQSKGKVAVDGPVRFECNSTTAGYMFPAFQSTRCLEMQRDQLRARVEELEGWIRSLETHPDSDGQHKGIDPDWQWVAKGRQIYIGKPKPEGLR